MEETLREKALRWFFDLNDIEKNDMKEKHFPEKYIPFDSKWGFNFTLGQIEEMYQKEHP